MNLKEFWPSAEAVSQCVPSEAEVISDAAFLAVHQPMRFFRRSITQDSPVELDPVPATEKDVLDALLTEHTPEGYVIVPIVGPSGVGKSHLIRWLDLHVVGDRHVIRIPKSTSLKRILESVLTGLRGPAYDEIRDRLKSARDRIDETAGEEELLAKFRTALRKRRDEVRASLTETAKRGGKIDPKLRAIAETHAEGAYQLLEGRTKTELLSGSPERPSVLATLVRRVVSGAIEAEHGEFKPEHFEFRGVAPSDVAPDARRYLEKLKLDSQGARATAAELMNELRDQAVAQLLGLGEHQLAELFRDVRAELLKEGRELVLLVEDFTTLAGVQESLLDVIKTEGVRGDTRCCVLRTALAVTEGFLSKYDTIRTRANTEFVIREHPADERERLGTIVEMVGAYLNAARLGRERLERWQKRRSPDRVAAVPSFEGEAALDDAASAALEAFGRSSAGHALFPFNRGAIEYLARLHLASRDGLRLNPRKLIKDVLQETLVVYRDLYVRRQFPPADFHRVNVAARLNPTIARRIHQSDPENADRQSMLWEVWGGQTDAVEVSTLPASVYAEFGLKPLSDGQPPGQRADPHDDRGTPAQTPPVAPQTESKGVETRTVVREADPREAMLERWVNDRKILQVDARLLRNDLIEMIDADLERAGTPIAALAGSLRKAGWADLIHLPFSPTQGNLAPDKAIFVLALDSDFDVNSSLLRFRSEMLALFSFHSQKSFESTGGMEALVWYANLSERAVREARKFIERDAGLGDAAQAFDAAAQALYLAARILDVPGAHANHDDELVNALFAEASPAEGVAADEKWRKIQEACRAHREAARDFVLAQVGARQGDGDRVYAVDAARLLAAIRTTRQTCRVEAKFEAPGKAGSYAEPTHRLVAALTAKQFAAALEERRGRLAAWATAVHAWFKGVDGEEVEKSAFAEECIQLIRQADRLGVYDADVEPATLIGQAKAFAEAPIAEALAHADRVVETASATAVLTGVVKASDKATAIADKFLNSFTIFLSRSRVKADRQLRAEADRAGLEMEEGVVQPDRLPAREAQRLDGHLSELARLLHTFAEGAVR